MGVDVDGIIDCGDKRRKVDMELVVVPNETTILHPPMSMKRVQWHPKGGNMKNIPDANHLAVKENFDGANAGHWGKCVVSQCDKVGGKDIPPSIVYVIAHTHAGMWEGGQGSGLGGEIMHTDGVAMVTKPCDGLDGW